MKTSLHENSSLDLVWAILGLEALYAQGSAGLKEQLVAKTEVLFGQRKTHKKKFGLMYDFRSRLLHGDIDLPLRYNPYDASDEFTAYAQELYRSEDLALAVLIATLQVMANRSWTELDFTYSASGKLLS